MHIWPTVQLCMVACYGRLDRTRPTVTQQPHPWTLFCWSLDSCFIPIHPSNNNLPLRTGHEHLSNTAEWLQDEQWNRGLEVQSNTSTVDATRPWLMQNTGCQELQRWTTFGSGQRLVSLPSGRWNITVMQL